MGGNRNGAGHKLLCGKIERTSDVSGEARTYEDHNRWQEGVVAAQRGVLDAEGITDEKARTILLATFNRMWEDSERDQPDEWFLFDIDFQEILDGAAAGARRVRTWIVPADSRGSWWLTAKGRDLFDTILYASLKAWHAEPGQRTRHG